ncbi:hypothetical protein VUR80DRAFT_4095 [Thermomyces stellatus]
MRQRKSMSTESLAEMGLSEQGSAASPVEDCGQRRKPRGWEKFAEESKAFAKEGRAFAKEGGNDPRFVSFARAMDPELSVWPIPRPDMELTLHHLWQRHAKASARALDHPQQQGEEWERMMDESRLTLRTYLEDLYLFAKVIAFPEPSWRAMGSAERQLRVFDKDFQFPFQKAPVCHRYLEERGEVNQLLRALLRGRYTRYLFPWIPESEKGVFNTERLSFTATAMENIGMAVVSLGSFGWVLFNGAADTKSKVVLFVAASVGVMSMLAKKGAMKHVLVMGFMAVMAGTVLGGRDNA